VTARIFISRDSGALCVGAEQVATAFRKAFEKRGLNVEIVRTGSRGLYWLEPLVEVERPEGRIGYGPVHVRDIDGLLDAGMLEGGRHKLALGVVDDIPWLKRQTRLTFKNCGIIDPRSLENYKAHGGYKGLAKALEVGAKATVEEVVTSGLRGRGGAGFPTGIKWRTVADTPPQQKYIVCNADEGDSGTFADRMIMEGDPFVLIEGMTIAGIAVGATKGYVYIRSEYPHAIEAMEIAVREARKGGMLGRRIAGSEFDFDMEVRAGAGADVCGEETALRRGSRQTAPPRPYRPIRQADRDQQRAVACERADHHERRRAALPRLRHGQIARHHADPARRQYQAWRVVRDGVWHHPRRAGR
jgi:formate dehydrogenase iron-sulfur subunit